MAIYDKSGNALSSVYNKSGQSLDFAYNANGEVIFSKGSPTPDYDDYTISDLFSVSGGSLSGNTFQAFDIYNDVIVQVRGDGYLCLIDLNTHQVINSGMTAQVNHGNSFSLSRVFFADGDEFPLAYATDGYKFVYVNRVTRTGATLVKTYKTDPTSHGGYLMSAVPTEDGKFLYTMGYTFANYTSDLDGTNLVRIAKWNLENATDNGDGTFLPEFIEEKTMPFIDCIQGTQLRDGLLFASSGVGGRASHVYLIDPSTAQIEHTIALSTVEVEGCAWVDDYLVVGQSPSTIAYKKIVFGSL